MARRPRPDGGERDTLEAQRVADAERAILGCVFMRAAALDACEELEPESFDDRRNGEVFAVMRSLAADQIAIDPLTVGDALTRKGVLGAVGGFAYLSDLVSSVVTADNVGHYVAIVVEASLVRTLRVRLGELAAHAEVDPRETVARAIRVVEQLKKYQKPPAEPSPIAADLIEELSMPMATFPTGFADLDALLSGGFKARQLVVCVAPPGAGKSGLALEIGKRMSLSRPVVYVSSELDTAEIIARLAAPLVGKTVDEVLRLQVDPSEIRDALRAYDFHPVEMLRPGVDVMATIRSYVERNRSPAGDPPIVIVDYLQDLVAVDAEDLRLAVSRLAVELRQLAIEFNTAIMAIAATGRAFYAPGAKKALVDADDPSAYLSAAKESGKVEFAASVILFLDTESKVSPSGDATARIAVAKARRGRKGFVGLRFHGPSGHWFSDADAVETMRLAKQAPTKPHVVSEDLKARILRFVRNSCEPPTRNDIASGIAANRREVLMALEVMVSGKNRMLVAEKTAYLDSRQRRREREVLKVAPTVGNADD